MKQHVYFEVVNQHNDWAWGEWYATEAEARQAVEEARAEGDNVPVYIRKTTCKRNAKGHTTRKIVKNMGLA